MSIAKIKGIGKSARQHPRKKMKISLKQKIRNWLMNDQEDDYPTAIGIDESYASLDSNGFRLQVYKANGGVVVETRNYDSRKDENRNSLYVITEDKDLGAEIGKIITMENLKG
jgi:Tfp pilus assembly pilus retraction ATPase PilT